MENRKPLLFDIYLYLEDYYLLFNIENNNYDLKRLTNNNSENYNLITINQDMLDVQFSFVMSFYNSRFIHYQGNSYITKTVAWDVERKDYVVVYISEKINSITYIRPLIQFLERISTLGNIPKYKYIGEVNE